MNRTLPTVKYAAAAVLLATFAALVSGCDAIAEAIGAPTTAQAKDAAKALEAADKERDALAEKVAIAEKQVDDLTRKKSDLDNRRQLLEQLQAEMAQKLATAPAAAKPILRKQISEIDAALAGLDDQNAQIAATLSAFEEERIKLEMADKRFRAVIAEKVAFLETFGQQTQAAIDRVSGSIDKAGQLAGNWIPGAGAVSGMVSQAWGIVAGIAGGGAGATAAATALARRRARRMQEELDEVTTQRDGARKVIAITEEYGIDEIAKDEATRKAARLRVMADEAARAEFFEGKKLAA